MFDYGIVMKSILVTGGAGYIGAHIAFLFKQLGYNVIIVDSYTHNQQLDLSFATIMCADYADTDILERIFAQHEIAAVVHCAGSIEVGISVKDPLSFYQNNVAKTITLLQTMLKHDVKKIIFSSTCAVYGIPAYLPLTEDHPKKPISPYGRTKLMIEEIFQDAHTAYGLEYVCLRYFNAAGALPTIGLGEQHDPETHLIPLLLQAAINSKSFNVFGSDYDTHDGTAVRDFLHVWDIAHAHAKALEYLSQGGVPVSLNLGTGVGCSVQEMLTHVETICETTIAVNWQDRRAGDPATLVADASRAKDILGWQPQHSDIVYILNTAYQFMQAQNKNGPQIMRATNKGQINTAV